MHSLTSASNVPDKKKRSRVASDERNTSAHRPVSSSDKNSRKPLTSHQDRQPVTATHVLRHVPALFVPNELPHIPICGQSSAFSELLARPKERAIAAAKEAISFVSNGPNADGASTTQVFCSEDCNAYSQWIVMLDAQATSAQTFVSTSSWTFESEAGQLAMQSVFDGTTPIRTDADILHTFSIPIRRGSNVPPAVEAYFKNHFKTSFSDYGGSLKYFEHYPCVNSTTGRYEVGNLLYSTLINAGCEAIGLAGILLDADGNPKLGDPIQSGIHFSFAGRQDDICVSPFQQVRQLGVALDLHSAIRLQCMTGVPTMCVGSTDGLSRFDLQDWQAGTVIVLQPNQDGDTTKFVHAFMRFVENNLGDDSPEFFKTRWTTL